MATVGAAPIGTVDLERVAMLANQVGKEPKPVFALVGAGLSAVVSGPTWHSLLDIMGGQLKDRATLHVGEDVHLFEQFERHLADHDLKAAAEIWKNSRIHYDDKQRLLNRLLDNLRPGTVHRDLVSCGLQGILTFNYDHLLEDAYAQVTGRSLTPFLPRDFQNREFYFGEEFFVAKLHGDLARWDSIVIGETDYDATQWPEKAGPLIGGHTLLVFGVSLQDSIVNEFFFNLPSNTRVHVFMPESEVREYRKKVQSLRNSGVPPQVSLHPVSHEELPVLIRMLKPPTPSGSHIDCRWSELPPSGHLAVDFGRPAAELRNFLFSDRRLAHVESQPGWGLSSFLAQALADRLWAREALAVRLEAKEWLCWDKYALQMLAVVDGLLEKYIELRDKTAHTATVAPEPHTLALALSALGRPVVICIEQSHRLRDDSIEAMRMILSESVENVKFVLASSHKLPSALPVDISIALTRPEPATLDALAQRQGIEPKTLQLLREINPDLDLNALVIAGASLQQERNRQQLDSHVRAADLNALCQIAVGKLLSSPTEDYHLLRALKACVIFRSPRTAQSIQACLNCAKDVAADRLRTLWRHGFLIRCDAPEYFTMSTSIRQELLKVLPWEPGEYQELSRLIGQHQKDQCLEELRNRRFDRKALYDVVPRIAEAVFHFKEAGDRIAYLDTVVAIARPLIQMYHYQLIGSWLDESPEASGKTADDARLDLMLALQRADLAIVQSDNREQRAQLDLAETALRRLQEFGQDISTERDELNWYHGIISAARHDYESATMNFMKVAGSHGVALRRQYDARLRQAQTAISIGNLSGAAKTLEYVENDLERSQLDEADRLHSITVASIHRSTLAAVRLQLFARKPADESVTQDALLAEALRRAEETQRLSEELERPEERRGRPDKTGIGLAHLQRAQAYFAVGKFKPAHDAARIAIGVLAAHANNRWWLMTCHNVAARSLARLNQFNEAETQLAFAQKIWNDSCQNDPLRNCELKFTEGLIALEQRRFQDAVRLLGQSQSFEVFSPCVMALHLDFFSQALARNQEPARALEALKSYFDVPIKW